jgi:hypothetical protein
LLQLLTTFQIVGEMQVMRAQAMRKGAPTEAMAAMVEAEGIPNRSETLEAEREEKPVAGQ